MRSPEAQRIVDEAILEFYSTNLAPLLTIIEQTMNEISFLFFHASGAIPDTFVPAANIANSPFRLPERPQSERTLYEMV